MIPLRDTIRSRQVPWMTWLVIAGNVAVFLYEWSLTPRQLDVFVGVFGMVPANLSLGDPTSWLTLITNIFLHAGWFHLISNMWTLYIFGDNVEDRMGPLGFLSFYLLGGVAANLLQFAVLPSSQIPTIGASGAIAAVLGAYIFLYPRSRVLTMIPIFILPWFVNIPALIYLGFWFVSQLFSGLASLGAASEAAMGGVAWWAHIGGFLFGLALVNVFARRPPPEDMWILDVPRISRRSIDDPYR